MINININEEEREFLLRVCTRSEMFCQMHLLGAPSRDEFSKNIEKIRVLREKFEKKSQT